MKKATSTDFDIVIVGGGIVGATMACMLKNLPLRVALVDRILHDPTNVPYLQGEEKFDPRVSALTTASINLFSDLGVWESITGMRCCSYQAMEVWDAEGTGQICFSAEDIKQPSLGTIVENSIVNTALYSLLNNIENLELLAPVEIEDLSTIQYGDDFRAKLTTKDGRELTTTLVVAADGTNSRIRSLAQFKTREWDYEHQALVTTVRTELPHEHRALQRFIDTGPLAFLPLLPAADSEDERYCSIVWSLVPERSRKMLEMTDQQFKIELALNLEHKLGNIEAIEQRFVFPLRQRHAIDYFRGNIVLVGDAAHTIHPLAGQGVNLGLLDAATLSGELARGVLAGRNIADPIVLGRYQRKRIGHNLGMMWLMEGFKHLFAEQTLPVRWLRNMGMSGLDNISVIKNHLARRAMGLD